jgi:hypothetical protein
MIEDGDYPVNKIHNNVVLKASYKNVSNNSFNFCHFNSCSLPAHIDEVRNMLNDVPFHVIAVSETWLRPNFHFDSLVDITGYKVLRADRDRNDLLRGGGVALYVSHSLKPKILYRSGKNSSIEYLFVAFENNQTDSLVFGVVYNPPGTNCVPLLNDVLSELVEKYSKILICGDWNINLLSNGRGSVEFIDFISSINLINVSNFPTNFVGRSATLIDLTLTNDLNSLSMYTQLMGVSTHDLIYGSFDFTFNHEKITKSRMIRRLDKIDVSSLLNCAGQLNWDHLYEIPDVNDQLDFFNNQIIYLLDKFAPETASGFNNNSTNSFVFSPKLQQIWNLKNFYGKCWRRSRSVFDRRLFVKARNMFNNDVQRTP